VRQVLGKQTDKNIIMCRLLYVNSKNNFAIKEYLTRFAEVSRNSREYQGHGWGCAFTENGSWKYYHNVNPIWEDDFSSFGSSSRLMVHARSAFKDEGIAVENNMPFNDDNYVFIFNGELRGVKIREEGRIGAEKIFNYIKRFDRGDAEEMMRRGTGAIIKRSNYVRAMNIIFSARNSSYVFSLFNEDPDYFTMYSWRDSESVIICSDKLSGSNGWDSIENNSLTELKCL
jgi:predicted glutamine amidotransferase